MHYVNTATQPKVKATTMWITAKCLKDQAVGIKPTK